MKKWKKVCAAALSAAMMFTVIEPASVIMAKAEEGDTPGIAKFSADSENYIDKWSLRDVSGDGSTDTSGQIPTVPEPLYKLDLEDNLDVITRDQEAPALTAQTVVTKGLTPYENAQYVEGISGGRALDLTGQYGLLLDGANLGDSYAVSFQVNLTSIAVHNPLLAIGANSNHDNWLSFAGSGTAGKYELWTSDAWRQLCNYIPYTTGQWTHYVLSVDQGVVSLYENGLRIRQGNITNIDASQGHRLMFGVNYWDASPVCKLDDIKVYDTALTKGQVSALSSGFGIQGKSNIRLNETVNLEAFTSVDSAGTHVEWTSENGEIATVADGVVTGVAVGKTNITAALMSTDNTPLKSETLSVTVVDPQIIADFDFNDDTEGFRGAGAIGQKNGNIPRVLRTEPSDYAMQLNGAEFLDVVKEEGGGSPLNGLKEFSLSYDSFSTKGAASWSFFAAPDRTTPIWLNEKYIAAYDASDRIEMARYKNEGVQALAINKNITGWKHVDAVFEEDSFTLYVNGEIIRTVRSDFSVEDILGENSILWIGNGTWNNSNEYFTGQIDNYKIYNYARTPEEVGQVTDIKVSSSDGTSAINVGNTLQLSAAVLPECAKNRAVAWNSSNTDIATVDANGIVTGVGAGTVAITAEAQDGSGVSDSIELTVSKIDVTDITIEGETEFTLARSASRNLKASLTPSNASNQTITWSSSNPTVAVVNDYGVVTGVGAGKAAIIAHSADNPNIKAEVMVTVTVPVTVTVSKHGSETAVLTINGITNPAVTVTAGDEVIINAAGDGFQYWKDVSTGRIISTDPEYKFLAADSVSYEAFFKQPTSHTVTYKNYEGSIVGIQTVEENATAYTHIATVPGKLGYEFDRWDQTEEEILALIQKGQDVVVTPVFKQSVITYTLNVAGGTIVNQKDTYLPTDYVTIIADTPASGQKFSHWKNTETNAIVSYVPTYSFYMISNTDYTAVFVPDDTDIEKEVTITCIADYDSASDKAVFTARRSVPDNYTLVGHGIVLTKRQSVGEQPDSLVLGGTDVIKSAGTTTGALGIYTVRGSYSTTDRWYARGYVMYKDARGTVYTKYSPVVSYIK